MPSDLQPLPNPIEFTDVLDNLRHLSREFLLGFRLEVGKLLLERFYGDDLRAYQSQDPNKDNSFAQFTQACHAELADLGLGAQVLRNCINARATYLTLPVEVRDNLQFTHVVELARVGNPTDRARLAMDTTRQNWKVGQLKDAIGRLNAGRYYDTDPQTPGTQPPPLPAEPVAKPRTPGRVLAQFELTIQDLAVLRADWLAADTARLKNAHRERAKAVVAALKVQLAEIEKALEVKG